MIKSKLLYILLALLFFGCSAEKRMARLTALHPELIQKMKVIDTIKVVGGRKDTAFFMPLIKDTITINRGNLEMRYFYNTRDSIVYLEGKCRDTTIIREVVVRQVAAAKEKNNVPTIALYIIAVVCCLLLIKIILK